ncbi:MAG: hypothetical protein Q8O82_07920 [Pseudorhodobacter sp.]|nr:hypothetical protein [Pseudorhodobacter sp.]
MWRSGRSAPRWKRPSPLAKPQPAEQENTPCPPAAPPPPTIKPSPPAQRHQIEQDAITAAWEAERLAARDDAIALLSEIADLERDDDGDVILGADANCHNDLLSRIAAFLATLNQ